MKRREPLMIPYIPFPVDRVQFRNQPQLFVSLLSKQISTSSIHKLDVTWGIPLHILFLNKSLKRSIELFDNNA